MKLQLAISKFITLNMLCALLFFSCDVMNMITAAAEGNFRNNYTVTYNGNGNTGGSVPTDTTNYEQGQTVTVLGNTGSLVKTGNTFAGWNTEAGGGGTDRATGSTFAMGSVDVTLYAKWMAYTVGAPGPAGGIVFYDKGSYSDGWRYLEAASSDQSADIEWGVFGTTIGGTGTAEGTGETNTSAIVSTIGAGTYAAKLCYDLELSGYDDWFLPSKDELDLMYRNLKMESVGGFAAAYYWSSSELNASNAWKQHFGNGFQAYNYKGAGYSVRAVRAF